MVVFYRALQAVGVAGVIACLVLVLQATPVLGDSWNRARLLYGLAGALPALALVAIGEIGCTVRRLRIMLARSEAALARIERRLEG
jgi:uncharacterized membrane protein YcjF (UPF0283 family)